MDIGISSWPASHHNNHSKCLLSLPAPVSRSHFAQSGHSHIAATTYLLLFRWLSRYGRILRVFYGMLFRFSEHKADWSNRRTLPDHGINSQGHYRRSACEGRYARSRACHAYLPPATGAGNPRSGRRRRERQRSILQGGNLAPRTGSGFDPIPTQQSHSFKQCRCEGKNRRKGHPSVPAGGSTGMVLYSSQ